MVAAAIGAAAQAAGASANGTANDRAAIQACLEEDEAGRVWLEGGGNFAIGTPIYMTKSTLLDAWGATLRPTSGFSGDFLVGVDPNDHQSNWAIEAPILHAKDSGGTVRVNNGIRVKRHENRNRYSIRHVQAFDFPEAGFRFEDETWSNVVEQCDAVNCGTGYLWENGIGNNLGGSTTTCVENCSAVDCGTGFHPWGNAGFKAISCHAGGCGLAWFLDDRTPSATLSGCFIKDCDQWVVENNYSGNHFMFEGSVFEGSATSGNLVDINTASSAIFKACRFTPSGSPTVVRIASGGTVMFVEPNLDLRTVTTACPSNSTIVMVYRGGFYKRTNNGAWSGNLW